MKGHQKLGRKNRAEAIRFCYLTDDRDRSIDYIDF